MVPDSIRYNGSGMCDSGPPGQMLECALLAML